MRTIGSLVFLFLIFFLPNQAEAQCSSPAGKTGEVLFQAPDLTACNGTAWYSLSVLNTGNACTKAGEVRYQSSVLSFCNATNWISIDGSSLATSCTAAQTGKFQWNPSYWQMEWCNGTVWKLIGPPAPHALVLDGTGGSTLDGNPITSCGGGSACDSVNPYVLTQSMTFSSITMQNGAYLTGAAYSSGTVNVNNGALIATVTGNVDVCPTCVITMQGKGYASASGAGAGAGCGSSCSASGGAHGGGGGGGGGGSAYGDIKNPTTIGSGGGGGGLGGNGGKGGGLINLAIGGTLNLNGTITAVGNNGVSGGFSSNTGGGGGGTINITTATLAGSGGILNANGGTGFSSAGAGGGGHIAFRYTTDSYTGGIAALTINNQGATAAGSAQAGAGTTYLFQNGVDTNGRLIVNNGANSSTSNTVKLTPILTSTDFDTISTSTNGVVSVASGITVNLGSDIIDFYLVDSGQVNFPTNSPVIASGGRYELNVPRTFNSVTVQSGGLLGHWRNTTALTNSLNITTTGNFTVATGGIVDVSERGYQGATGAGAGGSCGSNCSASGAAHAGYGGGGTGGSPYGSIKNPTTLGSGGGDGGLGGNGGRGGGLVTLNVGGTFNLSGTIDARGGNGVSGGFSSNTGGGAGGSINITTATIAGSGGIIYADGGTGYSSAGAGSGGHIALKYTTDSYTGGVAGLTIWNRTGTSSGSALAGAGTTYLFQNGVDTNGRLLVSNGANVNSGNYSKLTPILASADFDSMSTSTNGIIYVPTGVTVNLGTDTINWYLVDSGTVNFPTNNPVIASGGRYEVNVPRNFATVTIQSGGALGHWRNATTQVNSLNITTTGNFTINSGGKIDVTSKGYENSAGPGEGGDCGANCSSGGGAHGGYAGGGTGAGGSPYGSVKSPATIGSGGGNGGGGYGAWGGGLVTLNVGGTLDISGSIEAKGGDGMSGGFSSNTGGAAGGGINITTATLAGTGGTVTANGGIGYSGAGDGSGGHIALKYTTDSYTGGIASLTISNKANTNTGYGMAAAGTTYLFQNGVDTNGRLIVNNGTSSTSSIYAKLTPILSSADFDSITTATNGIVYIPSGVTTNLSSDTINFYLVDSGTVNFPTNNPVIASGGRYDVNVAKTFATVTVQSGGILSHWQNWNTIANSINVTTTGNFNLNSGGQINVTERGYGYGQGTAPGGGAGAFQGAGGGAHGGNGGTATGAGGVAYGSSTNPASMGSGGGTANGAAGGMGGGLVRLNVGGTLDLSGTIVGNGGPGINATGKSGAGGAGAANISTNVLTGTGGVVQFNGGNGNGGGGGGGGGRVHIDYVTDSYTGGIASLTKTVAAGAGGAGAGVGSIDLVDLP